MKPENVGNSVNCNTALSSLPRSYIPSFLTQMTSLLMRKYAESGFIAVMIDSFRKKHYSALVVQVVLIMGNTQLIDYLKPCGWSFSMSSWNLMETCLRCLAYLWIDAHHLRRLNIVIWINWSRLTASWLGSCYVLTESWIILTSEDFFRCWRTYLWWDVDVERLWVRLPAGNLCKSLYSGCGLRTCDYCLPQSMWIPFWNCWLPCPGWRCSICVDLYKALFTINRVLRDLQ